MGKKEIASSPLPPKKKPEVPTGEMSFPDAMKMVIEGCKVRRSDWPDESEYVFVQDGFLRIHRPDGKFYNLTVSDGDLFATDWVVINTDVAHPQAE
jgi:hypothetical protein